MQHGTLARDALQCASPFPECSGQHWVSLVSRKVVSSLLEEAVRILQRRAANAELKAVPQPYLVSPSEPHPFYRSASGGLLKHLPPVYSFMGEGGYVSGFFLPLIH
jgi:hypothetical protein